MEKRFTNKVAVVTGAGNGIGKAVALRLASEGAIVIIVDANSEAMVKALTEFKDYSLEAYGLLTDISDEKQVTETFLQVEMQWGKIDILVHAAGIVGPTSTKIVDYPAVEFDRIYQVNLKGAFLVTKYALTAMQKQGRGRILLLASIAGKEGNPGMVGYTSTKAGVIGLVKGVAKEYATTGITINGLAPAVIRTPMNDHTLPEQMAYMVAKIPMQRLGTVEEVAAMSCFIVSDENSFSTGFIYDISGGRATY